MVKLGSFWIGILAFTTGSSQAFLIPRQQQQQQHQPTAHYDKHTTNLSMCICIDCARVTDCAAYHFVESKHEQPHLNENPQFTPREGSPIIHVNIRTHRNNEEEIQRIWMEHKEETRKAEAKAAGGQPNELRGETTYDMSPSTTVEYDVVKCADFVEDKGCWVRNMPEEIKKANPNFVPT